MAVGKLCNNQIKLRQKMDKKQLESLIAEVEARMLEFRKIRALYNVDSQKYYYFHGKISECEFIVDKIRNILKLGKENP